MIKEILNSNFSRNKLMIMLISCLLFSKFSIGQQNVEKVHYCKGYLVFVKKNTFEQVMFLPKKNVSNKYNFKQLSKIKGYLIRGSDNYEMYKAKQAARQFDVSLPIFDKDTDTSFSLVIQLGVLPVELTYWETKPGKLKEDSGIPFDYKGKRYVINYIDDWDVVIEKIKVIK